MAVARHIVVLDHGQKIAEGTPNEIVENPEVIRAYLGSYVHPPAAGWSLMLKLEGVSASYGSVPAISDVAIEIGEGEAVGLLGANGAGKSTTLRVISGLVSRGPAASFSPAPTSPRCRRTGFRNWASPMCRRGARSFPR